MGGRGGSSGIRVGTSYDSFPVGARLFGGANATKAEKAQKSQTIKKFISEAQPGNVYSTGVGIGSGSNAFEIVSFRRSPNGLGIKPSGRGNTVALNSTNAAKWISNGVTLVEKKKKRK